LWTVTPLILDATVETQVLPINMFNLLVDLIPIHHIPTLLVEDNLDLANSTPPMSLQPSLVIPQSVVRLECIPNYPLDLVDLFQFALMLQAGNTIKMVF